MRMVHDGETFGQTSGILQAAWNPPLPPEEARARVAAAQQTSRAKKRFAKLVARFQTDGLSPDDAGAKAKLKTAPRPAPPPHVGAAQQLAQAAGLLTAGLTISDRRKDKKKIQKVVVQLAAGKDPADITARLHRDVAVEQRRQDILHARRNPPPGYGALAHGGTDHPGALPPLPKPGVSRNYPSRVVGKGRARIGP